MTTLYLVRHGETDWNKESRFQGCTDIELNEDGIRQAHAAAERLSCEAIDAIYSSELKRACTTADIIGRKLDLGVIRNKGLNEINFGWWEGLTIEEMKVRPECNFSGWKLTPHCIEFPGEGTLQRVQQRAMEFVNEIIFQNEGKNIVVVSHGGVLKCILLGVLGMGLDAFNKFYLTNTSISIINICETMGTKTAQLKILNDTCHLRGIGVGNNV